MRIILLFLVVFAAQPAVCQKADLDGKRVPVYFVRLPKKPFPTTYETYSASFSADPANLRAVGLREQYFLEQIVVPGFRKIAEGGHFNVLVTLTDYKQDPTERVTGTTKGKDSAGKEIDVTTYHAQSRYTHNVQLLVRSQDNPKIEETWITEGQRTYKSSGFKTAKELSDYISSGKFGKDVAQHNQEALMAAMTRVRAHLAETYGFTPQGAWAPVQYLDSEKHPDFAGFQTAFNAAKAALEAVQAEQPLDKARALAEPALAYYDQQKDKYDAADKTGRKLKYACLNNLMLLHFWLENLDQATTYANALVANDYDEKDGKRLLEDIDELKAQFRVSGRTTRHFVVDRGEPTATAATGAAAAVATAVGGEGTPTAAAVPASNVEYSDDSAERKQARKEKALGLTPNTERYAGTITGTDGKETEVQFLVENPRAIGNLFGATGNVRYAIDLGAAYRVQRIDKSKVVRFSFDGRSFVITQFKSANSVNIGASKAILEIIYESEKIAAYVAFTDTNDGLGNPAEYVIENRKDQTMTSLNGLKFAMNLNKGIKKVYDFCPAAIEQADKDGFKRNVEDVTRLAKLLEGCL
jgi:hypothetical protein